MVEIGIDGDYGKLDKDTDDVDWDDHRQWLIRAYYSVRYLKIACLYAFFNQECFHKLILTVYIIFQQNERVGNLDPYKDEYRNTERTLLRYAYKLTVSVLTIILILSFGSMAPLTDVRYMIFVHYCISSALLCVVIRSIIAIYIKFFKIVYTEYDLQFKLHYHAPREIPLTLIYLICTFGILCMDAYTLFFFTCHYYDLKEQASSGICKEFTEAQLLPWLDGAKHINYVIV